MTKGCIGGCLTILALGAATGIVAILGPNPFSIFLAFTIGIGVCFLDYWIYYGVKGIKNKNKESSPIFYTCPQCNISVNSVSRNCPQCGQSLQIGGLKKKIVCPVCGKINQRTNAHCYNCGNDL